MANLSLQDKTAYYNPYPRTLSLDYWMRNSVENLYSNELGKWYPYGLPDMYSNPSNLSHLIGRDDYYWARHIDYSLRHPRKPAMDYYLNYGHKYANRFKYQTRQRLSPQGQKWLDSTFVYLQRMMEAELYRNPGIELDSDNLKRFAFGTHPNAYIKAGFFCLHPYDFLKITATPDWGDILGENGLVQIYKALQELEPWLSREEYNRRIGNLENYLLGDCFILDIKGKLR